MRVKIFVDSDITKLEEKINFFLSTNDIDIHDIKFSATAGDICAIVIYMI
ncbi:MULTISPECIES: hypothetical protein [Chryseobacterium]|nr:MULTISPECIES: hypothetical protein [Chryseobacterium]MDR6920177.1 hypothetical protein [Chryseobacterium sp. 2987]